MRPDVEHVAKSILDTYKSWGRESTFEARQKSWDAFLADEGSVKRLEIFKIGALEAAWIRPNNTQHDGAILFAHGGGFQIGSMVSHAEIAARLADETGMRVLIFNYRLSPEYIFPAALEDTLTAYNYLTQKGYRPNQISLAGDSAGANLILGLVQKLKAAEQDIPNSMVLLSPWTDMQLRGASYETRADVDPIHQRGLLARTSKVYLGGHDPADPLVSPLNAELTNFPATMIQVGDLETVLSDAVDFAQRLRTHGVSCELQVWPDMIHVFQQFPTALEEARESVQQISKFITNQFESQMA